MEKDFTAWHHLKAHLHSRQKAPTFQEREIWWCSVGTNIGHEVDGKSQLFSRPVLIVRKFNRHIFLGVPLTTQIKKNPYYHRIYFKEREQCVMLSQLRLWEGKRLTKSLGQLPEEQFARVRKALKAML
jgi:mRNA interferase MazF